METRAPDYSTDGIDFIEEILEFREKLNIRGIYFERLRTLRDILNDLLEDNPVENEDIEEASGILDQLNNFKLRN